MKSPIFLMVLSIGVLLESIPADAGRSDYFKAGAAKAVMPAGYGASIPTVRIDTRSRPSKRISIDEFSKWMENWGATGRFLEWKYGEHQRGRHAGTAHRN